MKRCATLALLTLITASAASAADPVDLSAFIETAWVILNSPGAWLGYSILSMTAGVSTAPKPDQ
jgi:hypothetical protein